MSAGIKTPKLLHKRMIGKTFYITIPVPDPGSSRTGGPPILFADDGNGFWMLDRIKAVQTAEIEPVIAFDGKFQPSFLNNIPE